MDSLTPTENPNPVPQSAPVSTTPSSPPRHHITGWVALVIIAAVAATVGYLVWAEAHKAWPFDDAGPWNEVKRDESRNESSDLKTYRNEQEGFEIRYPKDYILRASPIYADEAENWVEGYIPFGEATGDKGIQAVILMPNPKQLYPNTDLDQAFVAIKVNAECVIHEQGQQSIETIDGNDFIVRGKGTGAAGHQMMGTDYEITKNRKCYNVSEIIHTSGFGAVEGVTQAPKQEIFAKLREIVSTFKFIEPAASPPSQTKQSAQQEVVLGDLKFSLDNTLKLGNVVAKTGMYPSYSVNATISGEPYNTIWEILVDKLSISDIVDYKDINASAPVSFKISGATVYGFGCRVLDACKDFVVVYDENTYYVIRFIGYADGAGSISAKLAPINKQEVLKSLQKVK